MTTRLEVNCINKSDRGNPHERIQFIGYCGSGLLSYGNRKFSVDKAIKAIRSNQFSFFVRVNGKEVDVVVAEHQNRPYLKTKTDGYEPNNLLSLPECKCMT